MTTTETDFERIDATLDNDGVPVNISGTASGPDADKGKLFEVPRVAVILDESDPNVLSINFSGTIKVDRTKDIEFYNSLKHGKTKELTVEAHVAGASRSHRRDKEGDVQAIAETKSLVVHSVVGIQSAEDAD